MGGSHLDVMYDALEQSRPLHPRVDQFHGAVEVLHILSVHLQEGRKLLQDVSNAWVRVPKDLFFKTLGLPRGYLLLHSAP